MKYLLLFTCIAITLSFTQSCRKACRVTGQWKSYSCPTGYKSKSGIIFYKYRHYHNIDSVTRTFTVKGSGGDGTMVIVNDSMLLRTDLGLANALDIDFNTTTLVAVKYYAGYGSVIHERVVVCQNSKQKKYRIRIQYELENQCDGSGIGKCYGHFLIGFPKIPSDYALELEVVDKNPY